MTSTDTPLHVFRTTNPTVVRAWRDFIAARDRYADECSAFEANAIADDRERKLLVFTNSIAGFQPHDDDKADPPENWRVTEIQHGGGVYTVALVPNKRRKAGKEIAERMAEIKASDPAMPGMPGMIVTGGYWFRPTFRLIADVFYARWSGNCPEEKLHEGRWAIDTKKWKPCKLSDYFLAVEGFDAMTAKGGKPAYEAYLGAGWGEAKAREQSKKKPAA